MLKHRPLTISDVNQFRELRLQSLRFYGKIFDAYYDLHAKKDSGWWNEYICTTKNKTWFGAFYGEDLIGVQATRLLTRQSSFGWGNYVKREWEGKGVMLPLYRKRIEWSRQKHCKQLKVYVLDGATRVANILKKLGFIYTKAELISHGGGEKSLWHWYHMPLEEGLVDDDFTRKI